MKLIGVVHMVEGAGGTERHYSYINPDHIAYFSKFDTGEIKTLLVLSNGTSFYCVQEPVEIYRELIASAEKTTSSPFIT